MCMCTFFVSLIHEHNLYLTLSLSPVPTQVFHGVKVNVRGCAHPPARVFVFVCLCARMCAFRCF